MQNTPINNYNYDNNNKLQLIIDTGSYYSFITTKVLEKINDKPKKLRTPIKLYTCLLEEFIVEEEIELEFALGEKIYSHRFYVLPKRNDNIMILGRNWIENRHKTKERRFSKTVNEALIWLTQEKPEGYRGMACEIKTKFGYKVVEVPYRIPQTVESKVLEEVNRLLNKGYIRESKSSWLNNVRPVDKKDGSVRLTTNLMRLSDIVESDLYSSPAIDDLIYGLRDKRWFSKIDLK
ncbi:Transposon Tf2-11 polyprotein, partial [Nosema granulosis]